MFFKIFGVPQKKSSEVHKENRQTQRTVISGKRDLNMASKTQILLLLLVAVMIASYGLTNATAANSTANSTAGSLSPVGMVGLPGLLIYTLTSTAILKLFQLI